MSLEQFEKEILGLKYSEFNDFLILDHIALNDIKKNLKQDIIGNLQCWFELNRCRFSRFRCTEFRKNFELAKKFRQDGNEQFRLNNFERALEFYHKVVSFHSKLFNSFIFYLGHFLCSLRF